MRLRAPLPSGTITFAFTDIEGSTERWERDRAAMAEAMRRHDAILRAAITKHGGHIFKTAGDAFLSVFALPEEAAAAMLAAQQALAAEDFSAIDGLRVRAAINTGTAEEREGDYFGTAVNKVARLLAIGHGGQILLTAEASSSFDFAHSAQGDLSVTLHELGAYHLKGFTEPQRVFQLLAPGLRAEFPPLRSLGTLPSDISVVDAAEFHSVPSFSGRDYELAAVGAALERDNAVAVVHGLGGVGKSSIAREYGWRNRDKYSILWWLNAQTEDGIMEGLLRLGTMFAQGLDKIADRRVAAQRVINSLLGGFDRPVLLVFDNLEDEGLMRRWLPRAGARALATSRDTALSSDIIAIPLDIWSVETAIAFLLQASGRADLKGTDARTIAETLGALPLAMAHAAASLRTLRTVSPQRYLECINEHLKRAPRGADYPQSVFATFSTAIAQAEHQAAGAAAVLCLATLFAPDEIPDELFRQPTNLCSQGLQPVVPGHETLDLRSALGDDLRLDDALGTLNRLSLLTYAQDSRTYSMHRLVQLAGKSLIGAAARDWYETAVQVVNSVFPEVEFATWSQCEQVLPHARAVLEALPNDAELVAAANLANRCSIYLRERAEYGAAESLCMRAVAIQEKALGPEHPRVASALNDIAVICQEQARYVEAESLHTRALAIREKAFGPDHPRVANSLNNFANLYAHQERFAEAESLHARALAIREKALGPDHPDVAYSLNNLANVYDDLGRHAEAEPLHIRALAIWEKTLGPEHPAVTYSLNNLGNMYRELGRYSEAEPLHTRALAICEKTLGPEHPAGADSLHYLAVTHREQGRYEEAEPLLLRALSIREKTFGPDHPSTKSTREALDILRSGK